MLTSVTFSPGAVDASAGARTAYVDVAATDVEGIMHVRARLYAEDDSARTLDTSYEPTLVSGTPQDGVWRFEVDIPGGTPAGSYWVPTWIEDNTHQQGWQPARRLSGGEFWQAYTAGQTPGGDSLVVQ